MVCLPEIGSHVTGKDCLGKPFEGVVTKHIGPYSVELDGIYATPLSLLDVRRNEMMHIMLDIETLGTRPGAVILSVALVRFSDEAQVSINLSVPDQQALGLEVDPTTRAWWSQQDPVAWQAATVNPLQLRTGLEYIGTWLNWAAGGDDFLVWCHGATFDCPLLGEVYRRAGMDTPWKFWNIRDTRTLYDLASVDVKKYSIPPPHIALNDALAQTRAANAALAILAGKRGLAA